MRIGQNQFAPQESRFEEISRVAALFDDIDNLETELLDSALIARLLGCSVREFVSAGFVIATGAMNNAGFFDPDWEALWRGPGSVNEHFPMATVRQVFHDHFLTDFSRFRGVADQWVQADETLRHHEFNPLVSRPFVTLRDGRHIAPQPLLALQRLSPSAVYYSGVDALADADANAFTRDIGLVFQEYVGRQLRLLSGGTVVPEIFYDGEQRSVDWFVIFDELVLLVEAKTTRLSHLARMGGNALEGDVQRSLGRAFRQVARTEQLLVDGHREFGAVPTDRPRLAVVVTLEPYWFANTPFIRRFLSEPAMPVTVASIREVEHFVDFVRGGADPDVLGDVLSDPERRTWNLANALPAGEVPGNPILEAAWASYPFLGDAESN